MLLLIVVVAESSEWEGSWAILIYNRFSKSYAHQATKQINKRTGFIPHIGFDSQKDMIELMKLQFSVLIATVATEICVEPMCNTVTNHLGVVLFCATTCQHCVQTEWVCVLAWTRRWGVVRQLFEMCHIFFCLRRIVVASGVCGVSKRNLE